MSDADDYFVVATNGDVWHHPDPENPEEPACRMANACSRYRRLRAEIAQSWHDECTYCADDFDNSGERGTRLPESTEVVDA